MGRDVWLSPALLIACGRHPLVPALRSSWLVMHVSVIMVSYAALLVGSLLSVAVLLTDRENALELRSSSIGSGGFRRAALEGGTATAELDLQSVAFSRTEQLDSLSYRTITRGLPVAHRGHHQRCSVGE